MNHTLDTQEFTAIDLFSGCGGLTEGLKQAGYKVIAAIEKEEKPSETYQKNHPETKLFIGDIRKIDTNNVMSLTSLRKGDLFLLAGCPPCQGFSTLRTRNRKTSRDERNSLIDDFFRYVYELEPKKVMLENVPGLEKHYRFKKLCSNLKKLGYKVIYKTVDVSEHSVPQRRRRLILLASRIDNVSFTEACKKKITVRETLEKIQGSKFDNDDIHFIPEKRSQKVKEIIRAIPKNGGSRKDLPSHLILTCHAKTNGFGDVYGRMKWDDVSPTITSGCHNPSKGRFLHPEEDRTITLREAAALQGFPSNYIFNKAHGKESLGLMIGNALPPPFIKAYAERLKGS